MNLPNAMTVGRIAATPLIALLPFASSPGMRLLAFVLYLAAAITDYWDGVLARRRNQITDFGSMLDPLADKLLLAGTFVPMFVLQRPADDFLATLAGRPNAGPYPFVAPGGFVVPLPWWVLLIVLGREALMTIFRQAASRRGVVISAIRSAKWKTGFQMTWIGIAYFWFFAASLGARLGALDHWSWKPIEGFIGLAGTFTMTVAVALTLWSLWVYITRYRGLLIGRARVAP